MKMMKRADKRLSTLLLVMMASGAALAMPQVAMAEEAKAYISVAASGKASIAPDMAMISLGVQREAQTAREALSANNQAMANVMQALRNQGIEARDMQTSGFNIQPRYVYPRQSSTGEQKPPRIVGYLVNNQISVRIRDLAKLGGILDLTVTLGVNSGGGISFLSSHPEETLTRARKNAVANALAKAKTLSEAAGVKLGKIVFIDENSGTIRPRPIRDMAMMRSSAPAAVPVAAGENSYSVNVNMRWEILQ